MVRYASRAALLLCLVSPTMGIGFGDVRLALAAYNAGPPGWPGSDRSPTSPKPASTSRAFWAATSALTAGRRILTVQQCQPTGGSQW